MNLFKSITGFVNRQLDQAKINRAVDSPNSDAVRKNNGVFKLVKSKGLEYGGSTTRRDFDYNPPEYDLNQIAAVIDIDSYLRRAIEKYVELILKNGFDFTGKNPSTVNYIRKRFEQIADVTQIPTKQLFEDIFQQLVGYANVFISKVRNERASGGRIRTTFYGKKLLPVAGYYVEDSTSMMIAKTENGKILGYKQYIPNVAWKAPEWKPENMIHIYYSRKKGLSFGTPLCYPVIDDIKALRKMEQNIEILSHQHTIPIIHYSVGSSDFPGDPEEVSAVKAELEQSPPYGCIVTTERHNIEDVNVKINAQGVDKLAELFKMRVYAGLGVSPLIMGEAGGAGRQTAESLDRQMENTAEKFMKVGKTFVDEFMIKELLLEGGFKYDAFDNRNKVELFFPPINMEAQNKKEEHLLNLYHGNLVTESEARVSMGKDPMLDPDRKDTYLERNQIPLAIIGAVDEAYTNTNSNGKSNPATTRNNKIVKKTNNNAQPKNQNGKSLSRPRIPKDTLTNKIMSHYKATSEDLIMAIEDGSFENGINAIFKISKDLINNNFSDYLRISYSNGYKTIKNNETINFSDNIRYCIKQETTIVDNHFDNLNKKITFFISDTINNDKCKNISLIHSIFDNYKTNFEDSIDKELLKAYNLGILQACLDTGIDKININNDLCSCNHRSKELKDFNNFDKIPPFQTKCSCILEPKIEEIKDEKI